MLVTDFNRDVVKMLTYTEILWNYILFKNKTCNNLIISALKSLHTAQHKLLLPTIEKIKDKFNAGEELTT